MFAGCNKKARLSRALTNGMNFLFPFNLMQLPGSLHLSN